MGRATTLVVAVIAAVAAVAAARVGVGERQERKEIMLV
jgi:hypothetical protein